MKTTIKNGRFSRDRAIEILKDIAERHNGEFKPTDWGVPEVRFKMDSPEGFCVMTLPLGDMYSTLPFKTYTITANIWVGSKKDVIVSKILLKRIWKKYPFISVIFSDNPVVYNSEVPEEVADWIDYYASPHMQIEVAPKELVTHVFEELRKDFTDPIFEEPMEDLEY